jgi:DNA-binding NtrC family response regulator
MNAEPLRSALVVDDEPGVVDLISSLLTERGWRVAAAGCVQDAMTELHRVPALELVIVDVRLPDGSGLDFAEAAKVAYPDADVVVVTGYPSYEAVVDAVRVGIVDYVSKPFNLDEIRSMVNRAEARLSIRRGDLADPHTRRLLTLLDGILQRVVTIEKNVTTLMERSFGPKGTATGAH